MIGNKSSARISLRKKELPPYNLLTPKLHTAAATINWLTKTIKNGGNPRTKCY